MKTMCSLTMAAVAGLIWAGSADMTVAAGPALIDLRSCDTYAILAGSSISSPGTGIINGDVGLSPAGSIGILPARINGEIHNGDAIAAQAQLDLNDAFIASSPAQLPGGIAVVTGELGGLSLAPGVYVSTPGSFGITLVDLTLDGGPDDVWVFQMASTLIVEVNRKIILTGGARARNVFWQVGSSATLKTSSIFKGTIMAYASITMDTGSTLDGRALAQVGEVTFGGNSGSLPENMAPVASADSAGPIAWDSGPITINVLTNDVDSDGDPLSVVMVSQAAHGSVTIGTNATSVVFAPRRLSGTNVFTYTVSDGFGGTDVGFVTVVVTGGLEMAYNDFDGDGRSDLSLYDGAGHGAPVGSWYFLQPPGTYRFATFGYAGAVPVSGDFDGDGVADYGVYDAAGTPGWALPGTWFLMQSTAGFATFEFGYAGTVPVVGDFDGDGLDDCGVYDAVGTGSAAPGSWFLLKSTEGFETFAFGYAGAVPVVADYDGDGVDDYGVYDAVGMGSAAPGSWYLLKSTDGFDAFEFGYANAVPAVGDYDGDGVADYGVYDAAGTPGFAAPGSWYLMKSTEGFATVAFGYKDADAVTDHGAVAH